MRLATGGGKERKKKREKNGSTDLPQIIWNYTFRTKKYVPLHAGYEEMFFRLHGPEYYEQKCQ